jgi:hypothetical protein
MESATPERRSGTIYLRCDRHYFGIMNSTQTIITVVPLIKSTGLAMNVSAVKKAVLLLGYPAGIRKKLEEGGKKNRTDVRPPPRWGIND